jgi:hypothetical protein
MQSVQGARSNSIEQTMGQAFFETWLEGLPTNRRSQGYVQLSRHRGASWQTAIPCVRRRIHVWHCADQRLFQKICGVHDDHGTSERSILDWRWSYRWRGTLEEEKRLYMIDETTVCVLLR